MEEKTILVDTHVHIYDCYDINEFFINVIKNFNKVHNQLNLTKNFVGIIFLNEVGEANYFKKIYDNINYYSEFLKLKFEYTSEKESLRINIDSENYTMIIASQQIVTSENLEVLALGTIQKFEYGKNIVETINNIKEFNSIPLIPWGVGKWFGNRGRIVKSILNSESGIFLGDNSGRSFFWRTPKLFKEGLLKKIFTLRGSDPLPIKSQKKKAGNFGFYFTSEFDIEKPCEFVKKYLNNMKKEPNNYGRLESPINFFVNQFLMQSNKLTK